MNSGGIDFQELANRLLARAHECLSEWLPGGRISGVEYQIGNLQGQLGKSLRVNIDTGRWSDFATGEKGGDLISLYAAIHDIKQGDAAKKLYEQYGNGFHPPSVRKVLKNPTISKPPLNSAVPEMIDRRYGKPSLSWCYRDSEGSPIFYVARYETPSGKEFLPWSWSGLKWIPKAWKAPRPLYGLDLLNQRPDARVMICEGEKATDAASIITGKSPYVVVTWPGGANAIKQIDWAPLYGRSILLWPDSDQPGVGAALEIAGLLHPNCPEIKIVDSSEQSAGWDAADALEEGWDRAKFYEWARPRIRIYEPSRTEDRSSDPTTPSDEAVYPGNKQPVILVVPGDLPRVVREAENALISGGLEIYQRDKQLVRPVRHKIAQIDEVRREEGALYFTELSKEWCRLKLTEAASFVVPKEGNELAPINCPLMVATSYLALAGSWKFPILKGIAQSPFIRTDDTLLNKPGYDAQSGLLIDFDMIWPTINENPTLDDANLALEILRQPVKEIPFVGSEDEAVYFSAICSAIHSGTIKSPMHVNSANSAGTGKSMLVDIISIAATNRTAAVVSWGSNDEESEKRFGSLLLAGDQLISIDNVERPFSSEIVCSYLTQSEVSIRPLGKSLIIRIPTTAFLTATGNGFILKGDMNRRALVSLLDAKVERPELRPFTWSAVDYAREHRKEIVNAALTIMFAYSRAGYPDMGLVPLGSFEQWSRRVRSALVWAGAEDPCKVMERTRLRDPERETLAALQKSWYAVFGKADVIVRDVFEKIGDDNRELSDNVKDLKVAVDVIVGRGDPARKLGQYLPRFEGRIIDGFRFVRRDELLDGYVRWRIENYSDQVAGSG